MNVRALGRTLGIALVASIIVLATAGIVYMNDYTQGPHFTTGQFPFMPATVTTYPDNALNTNTRVSSPNYTRYNGTILPLLRENNSGEIITYVGPANTSKQITLKFSLDESSPRLQSEETMLISWEKSVGFARACNTEFDINTSTETTSEILYTTTVCVTDGSSVSTTIGYAESVLNITINNYNLNMPYFEGGTDETFYANNIEPLLPLAIASTVINIQGLNNFFPFE